MYQLIRKMQMFALTMMVLVLLGACQTQQPQEDRIVPVTRQALPVSTADSELIEYLKKNNEPLSLLEQSEEELSIMDSDLPHYRLFLTGEVHNSAYNERIQVKLMRYLHKEAGVKRYMGEISFASAELVNRYLETGDEIYLPKFTQQFVQMWRDIYDYNQTLPENEQIRCRGVDIEHNPLIGLSYLEHLLSGLPQLPSYLKPYEDRIKDYQWPLDKSKGEALYTQSAPLIDELEAVTREHDEDLQRELHEHYFYYRMTVDNLVAGKSLHEYYESDWPRFNNDREPILIRNLQRIDEHDGGSEKYYGEFGMEHVYLAERYTDTYPDVKPRFAQLANEWEGMRGKVLSIAYMYAGSYTSYNGNEEMIAPMFKDGGLVGPLAEKEATIFKLNGTGSPFAMQLKFVEGAGSSGNVTTDYFQYMIFIKKSPATKPYIEGA